jgi:hypothetical protein
MPGGVGGAGASPAPTRFCERRGVRFPPATHLDAGRGRCTHCDHRDVYGFGDGRYDWGGWVCARCEEEWESAEDDLADDAQAELERLRAKFGEAS